MQYFSCKSSNLEAKVVWSQCVHLKFSFLFPFFTSTCCVRHTYPSQPNFFISWGLLSQYGGTAPSNVCCRYNDVYIPSMPTFTICNSSERRGKGRLSVLCILEAMPWNNALVGTRLDMLIHKYILRIMAVGLCFFS